nr:SelB translation factor [Klebsiella pneumoniae]
MEDEALVLLLIEQMRESGLVHSHHGWLHLPEHKAGFTDEQQAVWQKVETLFGDDPWWVRDLAREVHVEESLMRAVLRQAAQQGMITAIVRIVTTATIALCNSPSVCASWIGCAVQPARRISAIP